ncbi:TcpE family conjugal transfer membrane protein [Enterococcus faecalis]|uniref:TcpE family conjugal transfer membrane protein n=1 Tax=Enterococcus faecalis TaxID=1351 RepID=UPI001E62B5C4|nr:TcpE family conjugal transfer membrane protein [Enterococcus faecalis]MCD4978453.1 hypothetical protein [Enterococcus faecalis]
MDYKRTVNYSNIMRSPTTFKISFWKIHLPWTFKLETVVLYILSFLLVQGIFHFPLKWLGELINNLDKVGALGLPYLLTVYLMGRPTDGKPIFYYVKDYVVYYLSEKMPKKKYCQEKVVEWMDEPVQFTGLVVEKRKGEKLSGQIDVTSEDDPQQSVIDG